MLRGGRRLTPIPAYSTPDSQKRALFVTYGASHVAKVAPVAHELARRGVECLVLALTIGHKSARQLGLEPLGYRDFLPLCADPEAVLRLGRQLAQGNDHPSVDPHETHGYLGINYQELVDTLGEDAARERYAALGRQAFMPVAFMGRVIDALRPGVVVATSSPRSEEAAIRAAAQRGIPTLTMVDLFAPPSDPFLRRPLHASRISVVSEEVRERFIAEGREPAQVVVTGSPDFDSLLNERLRLAGANFRRERGWDGFHVVLWAGILEPTDPGAPAQYAGPALGIAVERELRRWVAANPRAALVVRYHPSQYHQFPAQPAQPRVWVSDPGSEAIEPLLHASDSVIHQVSTVGFQAALLGKRVFNLEFSLWAKTVDFDLSSLGPSSGVAALPDLGPMLDQPLDDGVAGRKMSIPPGPAAPRVAAVVQDLLNDTRKK